MPYDHSIPRDKENASTRRERSRQLALALVRELGRVSTADVARALKAAGLPSGLNVVKRAMFAAAETGEAVVGKNSIGHVRYLSLPGKEKAPLVPAEGGPLEWVAQALALAEAEPWRLRRGGWVRWSDVIRASGRCRDSLREPVEAAEKAGGLQTIQRGDRSPRRLWARFTPRGWRRFRSVLRAVRWLLTDGGRGDQEGMLAYMAPTCARPKWLTQPGPKFVPLPYLEDMLPATVREPGDLARLRKRLRRALKLLRGAGLVELTKHDGLTWVRALAARAEGKTLEQIAQEEGVSLPTIQRDVKESEPVLSDDKTSTPPPAPERVTGKDGKSYFAPELACVVEDLVIAEAARRFGPAALPAWML